MEWEAGQKKIHCQEQEQTIEKEERRHRRPIGEHYLEVPHSRLFAVSEISKTYWFQDVKSVNLNEKSFR